MEIVRDSWRKQASITLTDPSSRVLLPELAGVLVAQSLDPFAFAVFPWSPADIASLEGLPFGGFDVLANGVICMIHMDAPPRTSL